VSVIYKYNDNSIKILILEYKTFIYKFRVVSVIYKYRYFDPSFILQPNIVKQAMENTLQLQIFTHTYVL
jgi:hypothetical protein